VWLRLAVLFAITLVAGPAVRLAAAQEYLLSNDDSFTNGVSFYSIGSDGSLTFVQQVAGPGLGIGGGYFGMARVVSLSDSSNQCIFASEAFTSDIMSIPANGSASAGQFFGSANDTGASNGIGLAVNSKYLYASFSDASTIGTFQVQPSCQLLFVGDIAVGGLNGGIIDGMAIHGNMMIATYADGTIESFNIGSGIPVSNGDRQISTASAGGMSYPNGIDITQDGRFAIFGDTSVFDIIEVSDISSGKLTPTVMYKTHSGISSSNIMLSPDETILYISNTQGDVITAVFFDKNTGQITPGCKSPRIRGYVDSFSYLAGMTLQQTTGNGGGVYVAEFGGPSWIATVNLTVNGSKCKLKETPASPFEDPYSQGLLSLGRFPPRAF
jgi:hypothetical protein